MLPTRAAVSMARARPGPILTTAWVLTEVADGLASTPDRHLFEAIIADLEQEPRDMVVAPTQELFERGIRLYLDRPDKKWSLTDCISFVVMQEHQITEAPTIILSKRGLSRF